MPKKSEFVSIVDNYWKKSANYTSGNIALQRSLDTLMPFAGQRGMNASVFNVPNQIGEYWSSTRHGTTATHNAYYLSMGNPTGLLPDQAG